MNQYEVGIGPKDSPGYCHRFIIVKAAGERSAFRKATAELRDGECIYVVQTAEGEI